MTYSIPHVAAVALVAGGLLGSPLLAETHKRASAPIVITPAAVPDGSNWSRAPFPAARPQNDVLPPTGEAFSLDLPPNTPSTTPDPIAPPAPAFAVLQPRVAPGSMPTGRPTTSAAAALEPARMDAAIRNATFESRDDLVDGIRVRVRDSDAALTEFRATENQMSTEGRAQFKEQLRDVKAREHELDRSLRAAEDASSATWEGARAQLLADYDAYAGAVSQVDSAVGIAPTRR